MANSLKARADLVVGCDGKGSLVRVGIELKLLRENYDVLWFKLPSRLPGEVADDIPQRSELLPRS